MISKSKYGGFFPYPDFRENQELMLDKVEEAIKKGNHTVLMIDAPTGSGKTSVIAPILANKGNNKFIVAVRTNSQIEIYLKEINEICKQTTKKPSIAYLVKKDKLCKLSVSSAVCGSLIENTKKLIEYKINKSQLEEFDPSLDENIIETMEHKFDGEKPINIEYFIDENENTLPDNENEMLICPYYLFSKIGYYNNINDKISFSNSIEIETNAQEFLSHPLPPDQVKKMCKNVCPYECLAIASKNSDVTVLMHTHILDESTRKKTYRKLGVKQEEVVLLIDEAHNIGDETEQNTSKKFDDKIIDSAIRQLEDLFSFNWNEIPGKDTFKIIEYIRDHFGFNNVTVDKKIEDLKTIIISTENKSLSLRLNNEETRAILILDDFTKDEFIVDKKNVLLKSFNNIASENKGFYTNNASELLYKILLKLKNILETDANEHYFTPELLKNNLFKNLEQEVINGVVNKNLSYAKLLNDMDNSDSEFEENQPLGKVAQLLSIVDDFSNNRQYILGIKKGEKNKKNVVLELINIDPSAALSKIADSHSAIIMMSGTFSPIGFYELYYFGKEGRTEIYQVPNSFPPQNRLIIGINDVSTFSPNRDDKTNYEKCIDIFITDIPGNIALFFTSHQMKIDYSRYCNEITKRNNKEFFDQKGSITDEIFENFKNAAKNKGGVLLAVAGGALSEGKDYHGDALKGAMMIGFPLGRWNDFQIMKNEYFIMRYGENDGDFIANKLPAMNKALQALGRVIRNRDETGILILADDRFTKEDKYSIKQYLPSWIKDKMEICNSLEMGDLIKNWIKEIKPKNVNGITDIPLNPKPSQCGNSLLLQKQSGKIELSSYPKPSRYDTSIIKHQSGKTDIPSDAIPLILTNTIGMKFKLIPAGEFVMGSNEYKWSTPIHKVKIKKPFYLAIYPVKQSEWELVMGNQPSCNKSENLPVDTISWYDVQEFIKKLNQKEGTNKYVLPTEAEWEYAAMAGTFSTFNLNSFAWFKDNSFGKSHEVGKKKPNFWGIYDMHGNVWEWVQDKWHDNYDGAPADGSAWESGNKSLRVARGGAWDSSALGCRTSTRNEGDPNQKDNNLGFRLMKNL